MAGPGISGAPGKPRTLAAEQGASRGLVALGGRRIADAQRSRLVRWLLATCTALWAAGAFQ
eukprot:13982136-Alexandrium_andersonii.AAC.1